MWPSLDKKQCVNSKAEKMMIYGMKFFFVFGLRRGDNLLLLNTFDDIVIYICTFEDYIIRSINYLNHNIIWFIFSFPGGQKYYFMIM